MTTTATSAMPVAPAPNVLLVIEQKVEGFIQEVVAGVRHELSVIGAALSNVAAMLTAAEAKIVELEPFIESLGAAAGHPEVIAGVQAANVAMAGLNQFVATFVKATTGGGVSATEAKAAITGAYQSYRDVVATYNSVKATAVHVATQPAAPAPVVTSPMP